MKPQKHYKQVWIESEDDLPEKLQKVFVHWTDNMSTSLGTILQEREICRKRDTVLGIDWYLQEVEQPKGLTDEEIEKKALELCPIIYLPDISIEGNENDDVNEYCREVVVDAIQWARDQMQGNLREELVKLLKHIAENRELTDGNWYWTEDTEGDCTLSEEEIVDNYLQTNK